MSGSAKRPDGRAAPCASSAAPLAEGPAAHPRPGVVRRLGSSLVIAGALLRARRGLWARLLPVAVSLGALVLLAHCTSLSGVQLYACGPDRSCPSGLTCSDDGLCAPAEDCRDIAYGPDGGLLDAGRPDLDHDGKVGCGDLACTGVLCAKSDPCTTQTVCLPDGGCGGGAFCANPPECRVSAAAQCGAGGCLYAPAEPGSSCAADAGLCDGDGGCVHFTDAPGECQRQLVCDATGCRFESSPLGTGCQSGVCDGAGACLTFTQPPSNFDPGALGGHVGAALDIACDAGIDSSNGQLSGCLADAGVETTVVSLDGGGQALVVGTVGLTVESGATLTLTGSRPVILVVFGDAGVDGTIFAGARGATSGVGASVCPAPFGIDGAGGGGGGLGADGGAGGGATPTGTGPEGGGTVGNALLVPLRGGCAGGDTTASGTTRKGGGGGGAVQLSVSGTLAVGGTIAAPGGGGEGGTGAAGGAGGGSGGGILLEAQTLNVASTAQVAANGGSGGEGVPLLDAGYPGTDGTFDTSPATTPTHSGGAAGTGGPGGASGFAAGAGGSPSCGLTCAGQTGGGGGGAVGWIHFTGASCSVDSNAKLSPKPTGCGL